MVAVDGNFYVTNGTYDAGNDEITGGTTVKLGIGSAGPVKYNFQNDLTSIPIPVTDPPAAGGTDTPENRTVNLLRVKEMVTVTGYLEDESGTTAISKRNDLDTLAKHGGILTVVWGAGSEAQTYDGYIEKYEVTESPGQVVDNTVSVDGSRDDRNFLVTVNFVVGVAIKY